MTSPKNPTAGAWIRIHILFPLTPFFIDGIIRLFTNRLTLELHTFSAPTLAMSIAILSIFVNQSVLTRQLPLANLDDCEDIYNTATKFSTYAIYGFAGFTSLVLLGALEDYKHLQIQDVKDIFTWAIYILSFLPIINAVRAQQSFKLRATL